MRKLPDEQVDRLVELYEAGFSISEVAALGYVAPATAHKYLRLRGVKMRPRGGWALNKGRLKHRDVDMTVRLYQAGLSTIEVGQLLDIAHTTVNHRLKLAGVPRRERGDSLRLRFQRRGKAR